MSEFKVINTQEEFNEAIGERLARAKEAVRKEYEGFLAPSEVEEQTNSLNNTIAELQGKLKESEEKIGTLETEKSKYATSAVKTRIAHELGLGYESINYINGTSEEEIRQSAEGLKKIIGATSPMPSYNPEPISGKPDTDTELLKMLREMKG